MSLLKRLFGAPPAPGTAVVQYAPQQLPAIQGEILPPGYVAHPYPLHLQPQIQPQQASVRLATPNGVTVEVAGHDPRANLDIQVHIQERRPVQPRRRETTSLPKPKGALPRYYPEGRRQPHPGAIPLNETMLDAIIGGSPIWMTDGPVPVEGLRIGFTTLKNESRGWIVVNQVTNYRAKYGVCMATGNRVCFGPATKK